MTHKVTAEDCTRCGACCVASMDSDCFCDISQEELEAMTPYFIKKYVVEMDLWDTAVRVMTGSFVPVAALATRGVTTNEGPLKGKRLCVCCMLKGDVLHKVRCRIYKKRPETCKVSVVPGDAACLRRRKYMKEVADELRRMARTTKG